MKGHIRFMCFYDLTPEITQNYEIKLHITRDINQGMRRGFVHVPHLSPSTSLRNKAIYKWKKLIFTKEEQELLKNGETGTWFDLYKPKFKSEMNTSNDFKKAYNRIKFHLDNGTNILAVCYCRDPYKCHRYIIHEDLINEGYTSILE